MGNTKLTKILTHFLALTTIISLTACSQAMRVKVEKNFPADVFESETKSSKNINESWHLLTRALDRMGIKLVEKNAHQFIIKTDWVEFRYDEKNSRAILQGDATWLSEIAREKHRFEINLALDPVTNRLMIKSTDFIRQVEVDLASDAAVTYLQWQNTAALQGSAQAFLDVVQESMMASRVSTFKSAKGLSVRNKSSINQWIAKNILHVKMNKALLWKAIQASLQSQEFSFVTDVSSQTVDVDWVTLDWDDKSKRLKQPVDKEPIWAFNLDGSGIQQHRFNLQVRLGNDGSSYVVATHRGWREQFDATPDASVTMLEWSEKITQEYIAEAFLNLLSVDISNYAITEELSN